LAESAAQGQTVFEASASNPASKEIMAVVQELLGLVA
jgi:hypothetical protein